LIFCLSVYILFEESDKNVYLYKVFLFSALFSCISLVVYSLTEYRLSSLNYYAGLAAPLAIYYLFEKSKITFFKFSYILLVLLVSIYMTARGITGVLLICIVFSFFDDYFKKKYYILTLTLLFLLFFQYWILKENTVVLNSILTYRPAIWNFYFDKSLEYILFGHGFINNETSQGAAQAYGYLAQRGVGESYGTQSMYIIYLYESGIFGVTLALVMLSFSIKSKARYTIPIFSYAILGLLETVKIGSVSVYGFPLTLFVIYAFSDRSNIESDSTYR
jgi:hypothetical protein